jgi:hypothetical protein
VAATNAATSTARDKAADPRLPGRFTPRSRSRDTPANVRSRSGPR